MYRKILIPLDHSSADTIILNHMRQLAKSMDAALILVHVADGFGARLQNQLDLADSKEVQADIAYLKDVTRQLEAEGLNVHYHLLKGEPVQGIVDLAAEEHVDLIAMATHGHRFFMDLFLGSVADGLRHKSDIPILMLRKPKK